MIEYTLKFNVNPYDPGVKMSMWWPSYISERFLGLPEVDENGNTIYTMKFIFGEQYLQEFESHIQTLKNFVIYSEKFQL